jgi:hypothetical protein
VVAIGCYCCHGFVHYPPLVTLRAIDKACPSPFVSPHKLVASFFPIFLSFLYFLKHPQHFSKVTFLFIYYNPYCCK